MKIKKSNLLAPLLMGKVVFLSGCMGLMPQPQPTPEQQEMALQLQQAFLARMSGAAAAPAATVSAAPTQVISEDDLKAEMQAAASQAEPVEIVRERDGFKIGNQMFLDPEGQITDFNSNARTGDITYIINRADGSTAIKYMHTSRSTQSVTLATGQQQGSGWALQTATGKSLSGSQLIPTSRGFLVTRELSAFQYIPGNGIASISAPDGYHIAQFQNGDIDSTGYILLEKDEPEKGSIKGVMASATSLIRMAGVGGEEDGYLLMNVKTGQTVAINNTTAGKNELTGYNCSGQKGNRHASIQTGCKDFTSREVLYHKDGFRNFGHYFWNLQWFNTPDGTFAVTREAGTRKVTIIELATAKKVVLFERTLGIESFDADQAPTGEIRVSAQLGLTRGNIEDAVAVFKNPEINPYK